MLGCLTGRICSANDVDVLTSHRWRLRRSRAVEDTCTDQALERRNVQTAVVDASRDHDRSGMHHTATGEVDHALCAACRQSRRALHEDELRSKKQGLLPGTKGEFTAADPTLEAEVVADHRAGSGLAADRLWLDDQRAEAFRGAVDGGC